MPRRSNRFQEVVQYVYDQLVPQGFSVFASAKPLEESSGTTREVDILIEGLVAGIPLKIAIECRSRSRKDTLQWIDELIGKYRDLDITKVVAVNETGFSEPARRKAKAHSVELKSLEEALANDWPTDITKFGFDVITTTASLSSLSFEFEGPAPDNISPEDKFVDENDYVIGPVAKYANHLFISKVSQALNEHLDSHLMELFKVMGDFDKTLVGEQTLTPQSPIYLLDQKGLRYRVMAMTFGVRATFDRAATDVKDYKLEQANITKGTLQFRDTGENREFTLVQVAGKEQGRVFVGPPEVSKRTRRKERS